MKQLWVFFIYLKQARHLLKAENLPQQHLPEFTILHLFAAKNEKKSRGHAPRPTLTRVSHSLNAKYQFKQYLFRKYPSNPKFDPPSKIPGHGPA